MTYLADQSNDRPRAAGERASAYFAGDDLLRLLSSALEQSTNLVLISELDGRVAYVNPMFTETTGYQPEEVIGQHVTALGHLTPAEQAAIWSEVQEQGFWVGEVSNRTKSGEEYWVRVHISPIRDEQGSVIHFLGVGENITRRRQAEQELAQVASILEATSDFVGFAHADGRVRYVNRAARWAVGIPADADVSTMRVSDFHPAWTNELLEKEAFPTAEREGAWRGEGAWVDREGRETPTSMVIHAHRGTDGRVQFYSTISRDISRATRARQALRQSEERYRALYEDNPTMYFTVDEAGTVLSVNAYGAEQLGYAPEELIGRGVLGVFHPEDREAVQGQLAEAIQAAGRVAEWEFRKVRKDGSVLWVREQARAVDGPAGETIVLIVCGDITQQKAAEQALRESEQRYRALVEATPDMMFRVSKDGVYLDFIPAEGLAPFAPPAEFMGRNLSEVLPGDVAERFMEAIDCAFQQGEVQTLEYQLPLGKEVRHYEGRIVVSGHDEALAIVRDITASRKAEEALQKFREELDESVERRMKAENPYNLTFRELTVLQLVATGRSDRDIGSVLGIAPRTANKHVENILSKMGAASRTEAGVRALREGLVD
jgi:PAS domain S-box-containing protein